MLPKGFAAPTIKNYLTRLKTRKHKTAIKNRTNAWNTANTQRGSNTTLEYRQWVET
jgi:hypothetical protein